jgi:hypothetical protein
MAITEKQRHEFLKKAEEVFGPDGAETLMELLPPVGWADVATKADIEQLRVATKADIEHLGARLDHVASRTDLESLRADFERTLRQHLVTFLSVNVALVGLTAGVVQLVA